jgi:outer membrane protein assembly factor BamB
MVFAASLDDHVYAFDAASGVERWSFPTAGRVTGGPAVAGGVVFVGSLDGRLYALDTRTGALLWSDQVGAPIGSTPALGARSIYVGTDRYVFRYRVTR